MNFHTNWIFIPICKSSRIMILAIYSEKRWQNSIFLRRKKKVTKIGSIKIFTEKILRFENSIFHYFRKKYCQFKRVASFISTRVTKHLCLTQSIDHYNEIGRIICLWTVNIVIERPLSTWSFRIHSIPFPIIWILE